MKVSARDAKQYKWDQQKEFLSRAIQCPYAHHWHVGDKIEVGLELIICEHESQEALKRYGIRP